MTQIEVPLARTALDYGHDDNELQSELPWTVPLGLHRSRLRHHTAEGHTHQALEGSGIIHMTDPEGYR